MQLIKLKKILDSIKNHILTINLSFRDAGVIYLTYDNGTSYGVKVSLNVDHSNCQDFTCKIHDLIKALDCLNSKINNQVCFKDNAILSGGKRVTIGLDKSISHKFIAPDYQDSYETESLSAGLSFILQCTSEVLPRYEFVQFSKNLISSSRGYSIHEYTLSGFNHEFGIHRSGLLQVSDFLSVLEEYDILNNSEFIYGGAWKDGYAFKGEDSDLLFEVIMMKETSNPFNFKSSYDKTFKLNRSDLYDVCIQANKSKSSYIRFYSGQGGCHYVFSSNTKNLQVEGSIPVVGIVPDFKIDSNFLYNSLPEGRIVHVNYTDPLKPFLFSLDNKFRAYGAPLK
jgi:hypothetical protein